MGIIDLLERGYDALSDKSASLTSLVLGITNALWIYLFDKFANGHITFSQPVTTEQWLILANITLYSIVALLFFSILFGVIGIRKALSKNGQNSWVLVSLIGILLGTLPLVISALGGRIWFKILFL